MSKKITFILSVCLIFISFNVLYVVRATSLEDNEQTNSTIVTEEDEETNTTNNTTTNTPTPSSSTFLTNNGVTSVSTVSDYSEANLGLNNILNIILIAIGVLIILFAIAILIRLKH